MTPLFFKKTKIRYGDIIYLYTMNIIQKGKEVIALEYEAIRGLADVVNEDFEKAVQLIHNSKGRLVITGIGKSAIIAQKIVATMNSTGTPALYMHAADAIHGDLGMILEDDVVMIISKSGESGEIKALVPLVKNFGNPIIALCGAAHSYLATNAHLFLNTTVSKEACPNNLAPTTSTTAQMVMGDALSVCLLELKGFSSSDFAKFHPGGALGKRLYLTVNDLMRNNEVPKVAPDADIRSIIIEISGKRLGATAVIDEHNILLGIITDGDLRRMLEKATDVSNANAQKIMTTQPKQIDRDSLAVNALQIMKTNNISQLPVLQEGQYVGMIHIHDLLREGII